MIQISSHPVRSVRLLLVAGALALLAGSEGAALAGLRSIDLPLDDVFGEGTYNLAFRLDAFSSITSSIRIGDVRFGLSVPAPAPIVLLASAVVYAVGRRRHGSSRW